MTTRHHPIPNTLLPCRDGDWLLITVPNYWGKGPTIAAAKDQLRASSGFADAARWHVYSADPGAYLDEMGTIWSKKGYPLLMIAAYDPELADKPQE